MLTKIVMLLSLELVDMLMKSSPDSLPAWPLT